MILWRACADGIINPQKKRMVVRQPLPPAPLALAGDVEPAEETNATAETPEEPAAPLNPPE